jgi:deoxyribonuclease-4
MQRLGAHESIAGGLSLAFDRAASVGCDTVQVWTKNPRQWNAPPLKPERVQDFTRSRNDTGIQPVVAHAAYLINIASPKPDLFEKSVDALLQELERCERLEIPYLVLHPGAHTGSGIEAGLRRAREALSRIHQALPGYEVKILLETTSGQGTALGGRFEELRFLVDNTRGSDRLGVCLDTCHIFAAGYQLSTDDGYETTIDTLDDTIGLSRLYVIHLNDSQYPLGSHRDRHAHIGEGHIGLKGFNHLVNDPRFDNVPGILETHKSEDLHEDRENLATLRSLIATPESTALPGKAS